MNKNWFTNSNWFNRIKKCDRNNVLIVIEMVNKLKKTKNIVSLFKIVE